MSQTGLEHRDLPASVSHGRAIAHPAPPSIETPLPYCLPVSCQAGSCPAQLISKATLAHIYDLCESG